MCQTRKYKIQLQNTNTQIHKYAEGRPGPSTNKLLHIEYKSSSLALTPIGLNQDQLSSIMRQQG